MATPIERLADHEANDDQYEALYDLLVGAASEPNLTAVEDDRREEEAA